MDEEKETTGWSIKECEGCAYLRDGKCWYKNYPEDIPADICIELKLMGDW